LKLIEFTYNFLPWNKKNPLRLDQQSGKNRAVPACKYFTFTGLVVIFWSRLFFHPQYPLGQVMQRKKSEDYAHALIENLNHQVFIQFILPIGMKFGKFSCATRSSLSAWTASSAAPFTASRWKSSTSTA
jgi:hypothetical protein